jgi:uracil-DNA glycosylase
MEDKLKNKAGELNALGAEIAANASLPLARLANLVFGEGNINCAVMFIGEAPGETEDRLRRPFVGRGGQLLDKMIMGIGWKRADVYITNIVKRRPPENRDPLPEEIEAYKPYLARQIEIIAPKIIVPLGRFSMNYFLPEAKITRDHGRVFRIDGRLVVPFYHPAAALRSPEMMRGFADDFKKLPDVVSGKFFDSIVTAAAMPPAKVSDAKKEEAKPKQGGLF